MKYLIPFIVSLAFSLILTPIVKNIAMKLGVVDMPGERKIHKTPIPLSGGLAVFLSFSLSVIIFWLFASLTDAKVNDYYILLILISGLILIIGGLLDDIFNLKPWQQLFFPILAIIIVLLSGIRINFVTNPLGGYIQFPVFVGTIIAFFWILGMIYTTKFLDGLDGLVSGVTVIGSLIIFALSLSWDISDSATSYLSLILAGSCLGFLFYNFNPAKIFLGEGGSVFCGFMLGLLAIISGSKIATALLIMGIPILDVIWVIARRIIQRKSPASADRKHLHFRLLDIGLSHKQAVVFLYLITAAFGLTSLFLKSKGKLIALVVLIFFMLLLAASLVFAYKRKQKNENTGI